MHWTRKFCQLSYVALIQAMRYWGMDIEGFPIFLEPMFPYVVGTFQQVH